MKFEALELIYQEPPDCRASDASDLSLFLLPMLLFIWRYKATVILHWYTNSSSVTKTRMESRRTRPTSCILIITSLFVVYRVCLVSYHNPANVFPFRLYRLQSKDTVRGM